MNSFKKYTSPFLLLIAAMIWGFAFSAQKAAAAIPPFTLGAARSLLAGIFLLFVIPLLDKAKGTERRLFSREKKLDFNKTELIGGAICGTVLAAASVLQQSGIGDGTDAGKASFITALYVVIVPLYGLFFKKRAPLNVWISVVIAVVGFYLLCIKGDLSISPSDLLVFSCALVFAVHILVIDKFSPECDGVRMSCIQFFTATVLNLVFALVFERPIEFSLIGENIFSVIFLGVGSSGIAYTLQIIGQKGTNPAVASIILSLESVFGIIGSVIFLSETMTVREYVGAGVVFFAVLLAQIDFDALLKNKRKNQASKSE